MSTVMSKLITFVAGKALALAHGHTTIVMCQSLSQNGGQDCNNILLQNYYLRRPPSASARSALDKNSFRPNKMATSSIILTPMAAKSFLPSSAIKHSAHFYMVFHSCSIPNYSTLKRVFYFSRNSTTCFHLLNYTSLTRPRRRSEQ